MINIEHIENSISKALEGNSNLTNKELSVGGFSTPTMRHLFNNLCNIDGKYLEVGLYMGGTFVASFNKNLLSIGVEDYSQNFGVSEIKETLKSNINNHCNRAKQVDLYFDDFFKIDTNEFPKEIDILFYDGNHDEEYQAKALPFILDNMADKFIMLVDDYNWESVSNGTKKALDELSDKIKIEQFWHLKGRSNNDDEIWHNGVSIFLINKA